MRCDLCNGGGKCPECDGTGIDPGLFNEDQYERDTKIDPSYAEQQEHEGGYSVPCCECEGSGKCIACEGTGEEAS